MTEAAQNSNPSARKAPGRPFKPGQSGNPGGRPKGLAAKVRERTPPERLEEHFRAIFEYDRKTLKRLDIPLKSVTLKERNEAANWLADRGYGKAPAYAPMEGGDPLEISDVDDAVANALDDLAARREAKAAGGGEAPAVARDSARAADSAG